MRKKKAVKRKPNKQKLRIEALERDLRLMTTDRDNMKYQMQNERDRVAARDRDIISLRNEFNTQMSEANKYKARTTRLENVTKSLKESQQKMLLSFDTLT